MRVAEPVGGGARSVRGADVTGESDAEDHAAGSEVAQVRKSCSAAVGRECGHRQVLEAVRAHVSSKQRQSHEVPAGS